MNRLLTTDTDPEATSAGRDSTGKCPSNEITTKNYLLGPGCSMECGNLKKNSAVVPSLPDEPPDTAEGVLKIPLRLLDGSRIFAKVIAAEHTVGRLLTIAAYHSSLGETEVDLTTAFPKRSLRDLGLDTKVQDADVAGEMLSVTRIS